MRVLFSTSPSMETILKKNMSFDYVLDLTNVDKLRGKQVLELTWDISQIPSVRNEDTLEKDGILLDKLLDILMEVKVERLTFICPDSIIQTSDQASATEASPLHTRETSKDPFVYRRAEFAAWLNVRFGRVLNIRIPSGFSHDIIPPVITDILALNKNLPYPAQQPHRLYPLSRINGDIRLAWTVGLSTLNVAPAPLTTNDLVAAFAPELAPSVKKTDDIYPLPVTSLYSIHKDSKTGFLYSADSILECLKSIYPTS